MTANTSLGITYDRTKRKEENNERTNKKFGLDNRYTRWVIIWAELHPDRVGSAVQSLLTNLTIKVRLRLNGELKRRQIIISSLNNTAKTLFSTADGIEDY